MLKSATLATLAIIHQLTLYVYSMSLKSRHLDLKLD